MRPESTVNGIPLPQVYRAEWHSWRSMIQRCSPGSVDFPYYGARGITVCEQWRHSFATFFADMGLRPTPQHSLDRIDNNGNYEPGNCRWATRTEQMRNTRGVRLLTHDGLTLPVSVWSEKTGISQYTINSRLNLLGWSADRTLTTTHDARADRWK